MARQVLTESLVVALAGGAFGLILAYGAVRTLAASAPVDLPRLDEVHLDFRALLFAFAVSVVAGLLFGLMPAWRAARSEPQDALRGGGRSATQGRGGLRISEILVTTEVALSAALLVAAGLLIGSLVRILGIDQGFQANNVLTAALNLLLSHEIQRHPEARRVLRSPASGAPAPARGPGSRDHLQHAARG